MIIRANIPDFSQNTHQNISFGFSPKNLLQAYLKKQNIKLNVGEMIELKPEQINDLILYFKNIKRNNSNTKSFLSKTKNGKFKVIITDKNRNILEETLIQKKNNYGIDPHTFGQQYYNQKMTEEEKAFSNKRYRVNCRNYFYNSQEGDINQINFKIPQVKDRPLKIAFVAFDPRGIDKKSFSVGVNYLEGALKEQFADKVETKILDDQLMSVEQIKRTLEEYKPDMIGISSKVFTYDKSSPFLDYCTKKFPDSLTVMGGPTTTYAFQEILAEHPNIVAIAGNGEKSICGIAEVLLDDKAPKDIFYVPNIVIKQKDNKLIMAKQVTDNLNINPTDTNLKEIIEKGGMVYLRLSQGCWGHCTFCSQSGKWESADIDKVLDLLKEWQNKYNLKSVTFSDDEMVPKKPEDALKRLEDFTNKIIEKNLNMRWFMNLRADAIYFLDTPRGQKIIENLKKSHCAGFFLGIESGSNRQLSRYGKSVSPNKTNVLINERIIKKLNESDIPVTAGFIMFDPLMPTMKELRENLAFFDRNHLLDLQSRLNNNMRVQKGTPYIEMVAKMKLNLLGSLQPNLLTYDSKYLDPRVGTIKDHIDFFIEEIRPQYEAIYNANYRLKIQKPDSSELAELQTVDRNVKLITRNYLEEMINLFPESQQDKLIDKIGKDNCTQDFWNDRITKLTKEVNSKIPEMHKLRKKYKEKLNEEITKVNLDYTL